MTVEINAQKKQSNLKPRMYKRGTVQLFFFQIGDKIFEKEIK